MKKKRGISPINKGFSPTLDISEASSVPPPEDLAAPSLSEFYLKHKDALHILLLIIAALVVRICSIKYFDVISTDGTSYVEVARAIGRGEFDGIGVSGLYPVFIWLADFLIHDGELSGRVVSVLFGSLLIIPLYLLGKDIFSRSVALSVCMLVIVWPPLVNFSCEVMTQSMHTALQLSGVYFVWRAFNRNRISDGCLAGLFFGLTFLTRPEGLLLFFTTPLAFFIFRYKETISKKKLIVAYSGPFFAFFIANILLVHHLTGEWQISAKTDSALNDALSYYLNIPDMGYIAGYEPKGYLDILREHPGFIWKNSFMNIKKGFETILPIPLWILLFTGFLSGGYTRERNFIRIFLLSTAAPLAVLIVFYYISYGYNEAYLPVMFLWTASGFLVIESWLKLRISPYLSVAQNDLIGRIPLLIAVSAIYSVTLIVPQLTRKDISDAEYVIEMDNGRRAEKLIGILLKDSLPPGKIMTRWARIAFYAERESMSIPLGVEYDGIIKLAYENGVRFLIADCMLYENRPALGLELFGPFMDKGLPIGRFFNDDTEARVKGLRPFMVYTDQRKNVGVVVYELP